MLEYFLLVGGWNLFVNFFFFFNFPIFFDRKVIFFENDQVSKFQKLFLVSLMFLDPKTPVMELDIFCGFFNQVFHGRHCIVPTRGYCADATVKIRPESSTGPRMCKWHRSVPEQCLLRCPCPPPSSGGAHTLTATDPLLVHGGLPPLCGSGAPGAVGADAGGGQAGRQGSGGLSVGAPRGRHPQGQAESVPFARLLPVLVFLFGCALVVRSLRCA